MSGILDSKSRVMDTVITLQGRKQLADGGLKISYASFTDSTSYYLADAVSGSRDATERIYLESCCLPQDMITFEADDSGKLLPFTPSTGSLDPGYMNAAGQILSGSAASGFLPLDDETFASESMKLTESSLQNFKNLYIIGTTDDLFDEAKDRFGLSQTSVTFNVDGEKPIDDQTKHTVNINDRESLFNDPRFSRLQNFKFLPPLRMEVPQEQQNSYELIHISSTFKKPTIKNLPVWTSVAGKGFAVRKALPTVAKVDQSPYLLGHYSPLGSVKSITDSEINSGLKNYEEMGFRVDVDFIPRPSENRLLCQIFERKNGTLLKLDVFDFGRVALDNGQLGDMYFAGKVVTDDNGTNTFVHIFTIVFESYTPASKQSRANARIWSSKR